jgi:DNA-binding transcriptional MerR regulator
MAKPAELIGIGEFARRVRLSVKQLRSYDDLGLLAPAYVDPESGYRYYHRGQARTAITIALLRSLDVPLTDVHELLVADQQRSLALLARQRERITRELERGRQTLRSLERLMGADDLLPYEVVERKDPTRELIGRRGTCEAESLDRAVPALIGELVETIPAAGEPGSPPLVGLYPLKLEGQIDFFVGVEEKVVESHPSAAERVRLGEARLAVTTHVGHYEELKLAYYPLLAHAHERDLAAGETVREAYLDDPMVVPSEHVRTEVALPIEARRVDANGSPQPTEEVSR